MKIMFDTVEPEMALIEKLRYLWATPAAPSWRLTTEGRAASGDSDLGQLLFCFWRGPETMASVNEALDSTRRFDPTGQTVGGCQHRAMQLKLPALINAAIAAGFLVPV